MGAEGHATKTKMRVCVGLPECVRKEEKEEKDKGKGKSTARAYAT